MPSQLEGAMDALITVFYNYSGHDGDKLKLNKGELKELLNSELTDFLTVQSAFHPVCYVGKRVVYLRSGCCIMKQSRTRKHGLPGEALKLSSLERLQGHFPEDFRPLCAER